jgi:uncharacterized protein YqgQ
MFDIDELTIKWGNIGLLQGLPERLYPVVVMKYELAAMYLVDLDLDMDNWAMSSTLPLIYRVYNNGRSIGDPKVFVNGVRSFFNNNRELIQDLSVHHNVDVEMEMCSLFIETYYPPVKKVEPIKYIKKHRL